MELLKQLKLFLLILVISFFFTDVLKSQDSTRVALFKNRLDLTRKNDFQSENIQFIVDYGGLLNNRNSKIYSSKSFFHYGFSYNQSLYQKYNSLMIFSPKLFLNIKNFSLTIEPVLINSHYNYEFLQTKFSRNGVSGSFNTAVIEYHNSSNNALIAVGRSHIWWGQSLMSSLIINPNCGPFDQIYFKLMHKNYKLESFTARLNSKSDYDSIFNRYLAGHRISYIAPKKNFIINVGELFIYSGINKGLDLRFINPVIPYTIVDLNNNDDLQADNTNAILFFDFRYKYNTKYSIYSELIIDDFQIDDTNVNNALGIKMGIDIKSTLINKNIFLRIEKNKIDQDTYSHHGNYSYFLYNDRPIGFQYGQNCNTNSIELRYELSDVIKFNFKFMELIKGKYSTISAWDEIGIKENGNKFENLKFYDFSILHYLNNNLLINAGISSDPITNQSISGKIGKNIKNIYIDFIYQFKMKHHLQ